ncbi:S8 family serine peptidase [Sporosarcina luteola]|uniref:S8 family serine peptidase n=1 Tax=Sporosarcina luteola TaxID=582850 RepID=UPI002040A689|nr:S8 family serine peptidase [Sporosarcina luteola]MCM3636558.1 S8 family serine peptidase [Sporosarcina luteola]
MRNRFLGIAIILMSIGLWFSVNGKIAVASSDSTGETDRVIVNLVDKKGDETVESISLDDLEKFNEGSLSNKSSVLYSAQDVEVLQPDFIRTIALENPTSGKAPSWGTERVGIKNFKNSLAATNRNVIVAVIDTGVDYTHPFLAGRVVEGYDFVSNDTNPMDVHFHGTHVAGIIAETTPANVKIMPIRVMDEQGNGYDSDVAKGIQFAVDHGATIINMSFAGEGYSQYLADAIDYALSKNVLVVVAAGNESASTDNYFPASNQKVIVVSATDIADNVASFSNTGAAIDISAPGVNIVSSVPGGNYKNLSGTSMAAPYVSGIAAMLKLEGPYRSHLVIERLLKQYVDDRGAAGWDPQYGEGIVNIASIGVDNVSTVKEELKKVPVPSSDVITLPEYKDVPLNKKWTVAFNRLLTGWDAIDVKVYMGSSEIPIQLTSQAGKKEIIVSANDQYRPNTAYRLVILSGNKFKYEMHFVTGSK